MTTKIKPHWCIWDEKKNAPAYTIDRTLYVYRYRKDARLELRSLDDIGFADGLSIRRLALSAAKE